MLPLIDPDYLIIEHDPDKLRAYARGLLHQLRNPSRSYSFEMVKVATVWLVGAYVAVRCEPMFPGLSGIARNLRAFPQVQMRTCGLCRWLRSRERRFWLPVSGLCKPVPGARRWTPGTSIGAPAKVPTNVTEVVPKS